MRKIQKISLNQWVILFALVGLVLRIWASSPTWIHYDENYYINIAQNNFDRQELTPYMWRLGDTNIIAGGGSGYGILLLAKWLQLVHYTLFGGRLLMVFCGFLTAAIMYWVTTYWWQSKIAGIAAFAYGIAGTHPFYSMIVKMDAIAILAYSLVLLLHIYAIRSNKTYLHFLLGVAVILVAEIHILGILYLFALAFYYLYLLISNSIKNKHLVILHSSIAFFSGSLVAGILYLIIHVLPDPKAYFLISNTCYECHDAIIQTEIKRLLRLLTFRPLEVFILLAVIITAWFRRSRENTHYFIILAGWLTAQVIVGPPPYDHYEVFIWPLVALGIGGIAAEAYKRKQKIVLASGAAIACLLLGLNFGSYMMGRVPFQLAYYPEKSKSIEFIQRELPKDTTILGKVSSFYSLKEYRNFISYGDGSVYGVMLRNETLLDLWEREKPQAILLNEDEINIDISLKKYMKENSFIQVLPDLWIAQTSLPS